MSRCTNKRRRTWPIRPEVTPASATLLPRRLPTGCKRAAWSSSTCASKMRSPWRPIRVRSWCRCRVSTRRKFPIRKAARWSLPAAPVGARSQPHSRRRSRAIPTTPISRAAFWPGRPPACRRKADRGRSVRGLLVVIAVVAVGLCGGDPAAAQGRPKVVNVYNWSDYIDPTVIDGFAKETGITVRYDTFDSNDTLEAKLLAGRSGYDVVAPTAYFLERQIKVGVFQKFDKSRLPNLANVWPEIAQRLSKYDPGNEYAVNYMWGTTGIGYNTKK